MAIAWLCPNTRTEPHMQDGQARQTQNDRSSATSAGVRGRHCYQPTKLYFLPPHKHAHHSLPEACKSQGQKFVELCSQAWGPLKTPVVRRPPPDKISHDLELLAQDSAQLCSASHAPSPPLHWTWLFTIHLHPACFLYRVAMSLSAKGFSNVASSWFTLRSNLSVSHK